MIHNPVNIENDIVLEHGRWCLDKCMTEAGARRHGKEKSVPIYAANEARIQSIMYRRRADIIADRVAYCEGATL